MTRHELKFVADRAPDATRPAGQVYRCATCPVEVLEVCRGGRAKSRYFRTGQEPFRARFLPHPAEPSA